MYVGPGVYVGDGLLSGLLLGAAALPAEGESGLTGCAYVDGCTATIMIWLMAKDAGAAIDTQGRAVHHKAPSVEHEQAQQSFGCKS